MSRGFATGKRLRYMASEVCQIQCRIWLVVKMKTGTVSINKAWQLGQDAKIQCLLYPFANSQNNHWTLSLRMPTEIWRKFLRTVNLILPVHLDILNNHTFSVGKCVRRNAREETQAKSWSAWSGPRDSEIFPHRESPHNDRAWPSFSLWTAGGGLLPS
jgi:hypothetical protein